MAWIADPSPMTITGMLNAIGDYLWEFWVNFMRPREISAVTMNGLENDISERIEADLQAEMRPFFTEAHVDLSEMQAGDTIVFREYISVVQSPITYRLYATHTYSNAQTEPLVHFTKKIGAYAWKLTAQQTAGTFRTLRGYCMYGRMI